MKKIVRTLELVTARIREQPSRAKFRSNRKADFKWLKDNGHMDVLDAIHPVTKPEKDVIDLDYILERARKCSTASEFQTRFYASYRWAVDNGHEADVDAILPKADVTERNKRSGEERTYTDQELLDHAKQFSSKREWREAGEAEREAGNYSHHGTAKKRGKEFFEACTAHMVDGRGRHKGNQKYTEEDLKASALEFKHRGEWKKAQFNHYQAARHRGILDDCCEHMEAAINPYKDACYSIYCYEFSDGYCYIGLSCQLEARMKRHCKEGPVFEHIASLIRRELPVDNSISVLESGLTGLQAIEQEKVWQDRYIAKGMKPLWTAKAGSLGSMPLKSKWTKEAVLEEARKFPTKQAWIKGSQGTYRIAKREGWFDEAVAHMPDRDGSAYRGRKTSEATKAKQRARKLGGKLPEEHKAKISASLVGNQRARKLQNVQISSKTQKT